MSLNFIKAWRNVTRIIQSLYYSPASPAKVPIEGAVLFKLGETINDTSFDLAFHFSFNQNKLWTNWRSNRALLYNKPIILYRTLGPMETNVWLRNLNMKIEYSKCLRQLKKPLRAARSFLQINVVSRYIKRLKSIIVSTNICSKL